VLSGVSIGMTLVFASWFDTYVDPGTQLSQASSIAVGAVFGTALLWGGTQVHRKVSGRIDRAFFRSAYDARHILEDLADRIRTVTDPLALAELLDEKIRDAIHPSTINVRIAGADASVQNPHQQQTISETGLVVPILDHKGASLGAIALGERLSEEPYSQEDKRLVASVANQAGVALENLRLAEDIAARLEAERRTAREMEIAKDVQARLLPQHPPKLSTLSCAAQCIQARSVGGDYFDFLPLDATRVGLVIADISGKGVHAALLVANLQAYLRSQSRASVLDPAESMRIVNHMLWTTTAAQHYATMFYGIYDDAERTLTYVNCGHNPPILLRNSGTVELLEATALMVGLFEKWDCTVARTTIAPGDLLAMYSDGVTEASRENDEFGEERLIALLEKQRRNPVEAIVKSSLAHVQEFCAGIMSDDMTMLVARGANES
jgi:phosphoserine phosphatase RsbU/P